MASLVRKFAGSVLTVSSGMRSWRSLSLFSASWCVSSSTLGRASLSSTVESDASTAGGTSQTLRPTPGLQPVTNAYRVEEKFLDDLHPNVKRIISPEFMSEKESRRMKTQHLICKYVDNESFHYSTAAATVARLTGRLTILEEEMKKRERRKDVNIVRAHHKLLWKRNRLLKVLKFSKLDMYMKVCRELNIREIKKPYGEDKDMYTRENLSHVRTFLPIRMVDRRYNSHPLPATMNNPFKWSVSKVRRRGIIPRPQEWGSVDPDREWLRKRQPQ